jgi:phosphomevalonate kinase
MAIDTRAEINIELTKGQQWHFSSTGFNCPSEQVNSTDLSFAPSAQFSSAILEHWGIESFEAVHPSANVHTDSKKFFVDGQKLGLGSSAAVCNVTYLAFCRLLSKEPKLAEAQLIHRNWQNGKGSGLDIASSWLGGVIEYQNGIAKSLDWPEGIYWQLIWTGKSAKTSDHISHFERWRALEDSSLLDELMTLSEALCKEPFSDELIGAYQNTLFAVDQSARLNIFTTEHLTLVRMAAAKGITYKPCGAGGGDIGIALTSDKEALSRFCKAASDKKFLLMDVGMAKNGITIN